MVSSALEHVHLDTRTGDISWPTVFELVKAVAQHGQLPEDLRRLLKARLKSESGPPVLNTYTMLHTLTINGTVGVRNQLVAGKLMRCIERHLSGPSSNTWGSASQQLLIDWAWLFGREELGNRSITVLNAQKNRSWLELAPTDIALLITEERKIGMPALAYCAGHDFYKNFGKHSGDDGRNQPLSAVAKIARSAFWAARNSSINQARTKPGTGSLGTWDTLQSAPPSISVLMANVQKDVWELEEAEKLCRDAADVLAAKQLEGLEGAAKESIMRQMDRAYIVASRCNVWRSKVKDMVAGGASDEQLSQLIDCSDHINTVLERWQRFVTADLCRLVGQDTSPTAGPGGAAAAAAILRLPQPLSGHAAIGNPFANLPSVAASGNPFQDLLSSDPLPLVAPPPPAGGAGSKPLLNAEVLAALANAPGSSPLDLFTSQPTMQYSIGADAGAPSADPMWSSGGQGGAKPPLAPALSPQPQAPAAAAAAAAQWGRTNSSSSRVFGIGVRTNRRDPVPTAAPTAPRGAPPSGAAPGAGGVAVVVIPAQRPGAAAPSGGTDAHRGGLSPQVRAARGQVGSPPSANGGDSADTAGHATSNMARSMQEVQGRSARSPMRLPAGSERPSPLTSPSGVVESQNGTPATAEVSGGAGTSAMASGVPPTGRGLLMMRRPSEELLYFSPDHVPHAGHGSARTIPKLGSAGASPLRGSGIVGGAGGDDERTYGSRASPVRSAARGPGGATSEGPAAGVAATLAASALVPPGPMGRTAHQVAEWLSTIPEPEPPHMAALARVDTPSASVLGSMPATPASYYGPSATVPPLPPVPHPPPPIRTSASGTAGGAAGGAGPSSARPSPGAAGGGAHSDMSGGGQRAGGLAAMLQLPAPAPMPEAVEAFDWLTRFNGIISLVKGSQRTCHHCGRPPISFMLTEIQKLFAAMQAQHEAQVLAVRQVHSGCGELVQQHRDALLGLQAHYESQLSAMQQLHEVEIADVKARAVKKLREVLQDKS